jgi:glycosyltransferase involved in cell wall biosynthesis
MYILFDVSRLIQRKGLSAPTGIDRVDYAYATHLGGKARKVSFVVGKSFPRIIPGRDTRFLRRRHWVDETQADPQAERLFELLARPAEGWTETRGAKQLATAADPSFPFVTKLVDRLARRSGTQQPLPSQLKGVVYLHTSHSGLEKPTVIDKLKQRGARIVIMVHDLIPIDYPEYCRPNEDIAHDARMRGVQERADLILVNSSYSLSRLQTWAESRKLALPPVKVIPLGVSEHYLAPHHAPVRVARDYFVTVGTIEPRKNHVMLLSVWRRLAEELGEDCPVLVIVGRRGWEMEAAADLLERCPFLSRTVVEVDGLGDSALAALMAGARGVLQPSHVEGFSLPVAEALAVGAPLVASDILAHREMVSDPGALADPLDGPRWMALIKKLMKSRSRTRPTSSWRPIPQELHVDAAFKAITQLVRSSG